MLDINLLDQTAHNILLRQEEKWGGFSYSVAGERRTKLSGDCSNVPKKVSDGVETILY